MRATCVTGQQGLYFRKRRDLRVNSAYNWPSMQHSSYYKTDFKKIIRSRCVQRPVLDNHLDTCRVRLTSSSFNLYIFHSCCFLKDVLSPFLTFTWSIPQLGYNMAVLHPLSLWCCCTPSSVCLIVFAAVAASAPRKSLGASSANASSSCSSQCSTPGQSLHNITGYTQIMVWWRWCWGCFYIYHSQQRANMLVVTQCVLAPRRPGRKASETSSVVPRGSLRRRTRGPWRWRTMKRPEAAGCRRPAGSMSCYIVVQVVRCNADPPTHRRVVFANSWLFSQLISWVVKWQKVKLQNQFSFNKQSDASGMLNRKPPLNEFVFSSSLNSLNMQLAPCRLLFYAIFASLFLMLIDLRLHWLLACEKKNEPLMSVCLCVSRFLNGRKAAVFTQIMMIMINKIN